MLSQQGLGQDAWATECRATLRKGLRSRNFIDFGGLRIWLVGTQVVVTDGDNMNGLSVACLTEARACNEMERIARAIEAGHELPDILDIPADDIPQALLNAWID